MSKLSIGRFRFTAINIRTELRLIISNWNTLNIIGIWHSDMIQTHFIMILWTCHILNSGYQNVSCNSYLLQFYWKGLFLAFEEGRSSLSLYLYSVELLSGWFSFVKYVHFITILNTQIGVIEIQLIYIQ